MSELALYRKYRSRRFGEVVGQPHVVSTLEGALARGRVSHAYLFTGPRGVGKTSVARLLARAVNCADTAADRPRPCGSCQPCRVPLGGNLDVIEIDAASNRRIDEIRDLRDKIGLAPSMGRYKVYIIDEVHMLTTEAFNALLKTLEEPPAHAIFILATTEAHKLPETIVSRTQRFNFKPITPADIKGHLAAIAKQETIDIDEGALALLATAAGGSFRDAISLLDQISANGSAPIDAAAVRAVLGWSDSETVDELSMAIAAGDPAAALAALDRMLEQGAQAGQIIQQLIERWRGFMLAGARGTGDADQAASQVLGRLPLAKVVAVIEQLAAAAKSPWPGLALESTLVSLCLPPEPSTAPPPVQAAVPVVRRPAAPVPPPVADTASTPNADLWPKVLILIKADNNSLYALLRSCQVAVTKTQVILTCRFKFHRERLLEPKNRQIIESALKRVYGTDLQLVCQLESAPAAAPAPAEPRSRDEELVSSALEIFGGEVVDG